MDKLTIYPETLRWALQVSQADASAVAQHKGLQDFPEWLQAHDPIGLSYQKVHDLSHLMHVTFGALVRSVQPQVAEEQLVSYRTIDNASTEPSKNLLDVIALMRVRQDWARNELLELGLDRNSLVGSVNGDISNGDTSDTQLAQAAVSRLGLDADWARKAKTGRERFKNLKEQASAAGLMVMVSSQVGNDRRKLDLAEFRAFVLIDDIAPLIFINRNDTYSGMLFSLLHEIGHVLLGQPEIYNESSAHPTSKSTEQLINRMVAKAVMSDQRFEQEWQEDISQGLSPVETANDLSSSYGLSALSFGIRASQVGLADEQLVDQLREQMVQNLRSRDTMRDKGRNGGDANSTNASRLDTRFVSLVQSGIDRGAISYTDGFDLLGVKTLAAYKGLLEKKRLVS